MTKREVIITITAMATSPISLSFRKDLPSLVGGKRQASHMTAAHLHSDYVLRKITEQLDLTPNTLGRLIGKEGKNVYPWFSNGQSPSQAYWVRIAHIVMMAGQGVNLKRVRTIDWSAPPFEIEWWPGGEPEEEQPHGNAKNGAEGANVGGSSWRDVPDPNSDSNV